MSEHERQTNFVIQILAYDETSERQVLQDKMRRTRSDEGCVRRAACLMLLFAGLAIAGLVYAIVFAADFPLDLTQLLTHLSIKALAVVALGSLFCAVAFIALGLFYRRELNWHREECRRLGMKLLEARLGKPGSPARNGTREARAASPASPLEFNERPDSQFNSLPGTENRGTFSS